jgi:hypothetical protein
LFSICFRWVNKICNFINQISLYKNHRSIHIYAAWCWHRSIYRASIFIILCDNCNDEREEKAWRDSYFVNVHKTMQLSCNYLVNMYYIILISIFVNFIHLACLTQSVECWPFKPLVASSSLAAGLYPVFNHKFQYKHNYNLQILRLLILILILIFSRLTVTFELNVTYFPCLQLYFWFYLEIEINCN